MKILVTNDDGIAADGLWTLVRELKKVAQVVVVAPDREQSAVGTAVTLSQPLRAQRARPLVRDIEAYSVVGTPADSVILGLGKLITDKVDLVVSGINHGLNLGNDVLISGTVSGALQGYLRGFPALAVSVASENTAYVANAARVAALLAKKMGTDSLPANFLLNVNLPDLPLAEIKGVKVTRLATASHIDTVEEGHDGKRKYYWLVRKSINKDRDSTTDIWAIEQGNISITPLHIYQNGKSAPVVSDSFCSDFLKELRENRD